MLIWWGLPRRITRFMLVQMLYSIWRIWNHQFPGGWNSLPTVPYTYAFNLHHPQKWNARKSMHKPIPLASLASQPSVEKMSLSISSLSRVALPISAWVFGHGHESQHEILNITYKQICNVGNSFDAIKKWLSASIVHLKCQIRTPSLGHTATQSQIRPILSLPPEHTPLLPPLPIQRTIGEVHIGGWEVCMLWKRGLSTEVRVRWRNFLACCMRITSWRLCLYSVWCGNRILRRSQRRSWGISNFLTALWCSLSLGKRRRGLVVWHVWIFFLTRWGRSCPSIKSARRCHIAIWLCSCLPWSYCAQGPYSPARHVWQSSNSPLAPKAWDKSRMHGHYGHAS